MRSQFYSGRWFDHKGGQLHNHKKHNVISDKARIDKAVKAGTKRPETNQSSIISIVSLTKISKDHIKDNVTSLH